MFNEIGFSFTVLLNAGRSTQFLRFNTNSKQGKLDGGRGNFYPGGLITGTIFFCLKPKVAGPITGGGPFKRGAHKRFFTIRE